MDLNAELAARHAAIGGPGGLRAGRRMARIGNLTTLGTAILMWPVLALGSADDSPAGRGAIPVVRPAPAPAPVAVAVAVAARSDGREAVSALTGRGTGLAIQLASVSGTRR